ncbi:hypothetical protein J2Z31_004524 [Sinorhizobium kostiense]|uniref:Transposase n=1 Tax=Sinorhizobium kostiense TaxID=76747 RepID=A0ABS4R521_9HYPH|nr:hypothetical protein [Sinorhizobium kostiense]MBP2237997.1 hypothetical protein [Sinorhizobium kostiense]
MSAISSAICRHLTAVRASAQWRLATPEIFAQKDWLSSKTIRGRKAIEISVSSIVGGYEGYSPQPVEGVAL